MSEALRNWAGNLKFSTEAVHVPQSMEQLQDLVRGSTNLRSFGARHSFNAIADCTGDFEVHMKPGEGTIDFGRMFKRIEATGFTGHYMNAFGTLDDMNEARDYLVDCAADAGVAID